MRRQKPASWLNAFVAVVGVEGRRRAVHAGVRGRLREQTVRDADGPDKHVLHARACRSVPTTTVLVGTPVSYVSGDISTSFGAIDLILGHSPGLGRPRGWARARARRTRWRRPRPRRRARRRRRPSPCWWQGRTARKKNPPGCWRPTKGTGAGRGCTGDVLPSLGGGGRGLRAWEGGGRSVAVRRL